MMDMDLFDTDELQQITNEAVAGELPVLTEDLGHELQNLIKIVNAPTKEFDTTLWGNVLLLDTEYEGLSLSPSTEKITLVFGVLGGKMVRRVKIAAGHVFPLIELLSTALPEDGEDLEVMTLEEIRDQLVAWAWQGKHANKDNLHVEVIRDDETPRVRMVLITVTNSYGIRAVPYDDGHIYMACEYSAREPLPGETWTRGGDLADGSFNEATWKRIVHDILSVELTEAAERSTHA